jgi:hypothetical protein
MYEPLDASKHQIRLLHLLAGEDDAKLCCTFSVASLDDDPEYEAASYAWGSWDDPGSIEVGTNKAVISITKNLQSVLRNVRFQDRSRTLGVDALCINQQDLGERGTQIGMMARAYEQVKCVLASLDTFEPIPALQAIRRYCSFIQSLKSFTTPQEEARGRLRALDGALPGAASITHLQ